jgi:hypothetical protein
VESERALAASTGTINPTDRAFVEISDEILHFGIVAKGTVAFALAHRLSV